MRRKRNADIDSDLEYNENNQEDIDFTDSEEPDIYDDFLDESLENDEDPAERKKNLKKEFYVKRS